MEERKAVDLARAISYIDTFHVKEKDTGKEILVIIPCLSRKGSNFVLEYDGLELADSVREKMSTKEGLFVHPLGKLNSFIFWDDFHDYEGDKFSEQERNEYLRKLNYVQVHVGMSPYCHRTFGVWFKLA